MLKLSSNVSHVFRKVLKLSSEVSECKPLHYGEDDYKYLWQSARKVNKGGCVKDGELVDPEVGPRAAEVFRGCLGRAQRVFMWFSGGV